MKRATPPLLAALCLLVLKGVSCSLSSSSAGTIHVIPHNDLPSILTWAVLDPGYVTTTLDDLNATLSTFSSSLDDVQLTRTRKRRTLKLKGDPYLALEVRFKVPMFQVIDDTFLTLEMPISTNIVLPLDTNGRGGAREMMPALLSLEKLIELTGMDGRTCVLRSICELSSAPMLKPYGLAGELLGILVRNMVDITYSEGDEYDFWSENEVEGRETKTKDLDTKILKEATKEYVKAGLRGREGGECWQAFPECPISLFNLLHSF